MSEPVTVQFGVHRLVFLDHPDDATIALRRETLRPEEHFDPYCCGLCSLALRHGATFTWDESGTMHAAGPRQHHEVEDRTCSD